MLDLESILKQITPDNDDDLNPSKDTGRFRRNEFSPQSSDVNHEKHTEKRETDAEDSKKFSAVKLPDLMEATQQEMSKNTNSDGSSGSGESDESEESGSGESNEAKPEEESKNKESEEGNNTIKKSSTATKKPSHSASEANFISSIEEAEGKSESGESESGSGEASGSGSEDITGSKRNIMESVPKQVVSLPSPVSVSGNVSKVVMTTPGNMTEQPMLKEEKKNSTENHTLTEIKYFKEDEPKKLDDKQLVNKQENQTFGDVLSTLKANDTLLKPSVTNSTPEVTNLQSPSNLTSPVNVTLPTNNTSSVKTNETTGKHETADGTKKYSLPRTPEEIELSAEANKLFNFEPETTGDAGKELVSSNNKNTKAENDDDSDEELPGGQGGQIGEDLMNASSNDKVQNESNEKKSFIRKTPGSKKWKVVEGNGNFGEIGSGSGITSDEIKMEVESTIGSSFDASMKKASTGADGEILPGDYGDENSLPLSELSGSGSGTSDESGNGDINESGSGDTTTETTSQVTETGTTTGRTEIENVPTLSASKRSNATVPTTTDTDYSGESESGSGDESGSGSGSGNTETTNNSDEESEEEEPEAKHVHSPFGLSAIDAMSDGTKLAFSRRNMTASSFNTTTTVGEGEIDNQSNAETEEEQQSEEADSGSGEEEDGSGETEDTEGNPAKSEEKEQADEFDLPKKSTQSQETGLAKDQVTRIGSNEEETITTQPNESQTGNEKNDEANEEESKDNQGKIHRYIRMI